MRSLLTLTLASALLTAGLASVGGASASAGPVARDHVRSVTVHRHGADTTITFRRRHAGEVFLRAGVSARGVSWERKGAESAVVSAYVDGHYATDIIAMSPRDITRQYALGRLGAGRHTLRLHYATKRSSENAGFGKLQNIRFRTVRPGSTAYAVARYEPVLYGRDVAGLGGRFQNNRTDTPLVAWHQVLPASTPGHSVIEYSVMWSNEDEGTNTPLLMAQWGRTTDIEWVYRVEVDARGRRVPGTGVFQGGGHGTTAFAGKYDGTHPLLETCTGNNNMCDTIDDPMRFALSFRKALPADQPREHEMDIHPWTYQITSREMIREGKIESPSDPSTLLVGDQRNYLYLAVDRTTSPASSASTTGLAIGVQLTGDPTIYRSDHEIPIATVTHDGPAATTVELPAGTTLDDIQDIIAIRVPTGSTDDGATLTVSGLSRAFFLSHDYLPGPSLPADDSTVTLSSGNNTQVIWSKP